MNTQTDKIREALEAHLRSIRAVWSKADQGLRDDLEKLRGETFAILSELEAQPQQEPVLRPAVLWFAQQMEAKLRANDHKSGWEGMSWEDLIYRLRDETIELGSLFDKSTGKVLGGSNDIIKEAADVANFAMMLADNYGPRIGSTPSPQAPDNSGSWISVDRIMEEIQEHCRVKLAGRGMPSFFFNDLRARLTKAAQ